MTKGRQESVESQLHELQRSYYYNHEDKRELKHLLKMVNGNKDRLILILVMMLARHNDEIGSVHVLGELKKESKNSIIDEILLEL